MRRQTSLLKPRLALVAVAASVATAGLVAAQASPQNSAQTIDTVSRFLESGHPALTAYRARRHLVAVSRGGKMTAQMDAWTTLSPSGRFSFEVVQESGSSLLRQRVLRAALVEEQDNYASS